MCLPASCLPSLPSHSVTFWTDICGAAGCLCSLSIKHLKVCVHPGWRPVTHCFYDCVAELLRCSQCRGCLICLQCELLYKLFWESLFNGKNTVSCSWLINAERCISPFFFFYRGTNESQLWHILISSFVTICFLSLFAWCSFDQTISHSVRPYFDPTL